MKKWIGDGLVECIEVCMVYTDSPAGSAGIVAVVGAQRWREDSGPERPRELFTTRLPDVSDRSGCRHQYRYLHDGSDDQECLPHFLCVLLLVNPCLQNRFDTASSFNPRAAERASRPVTSEPESSRPQFTQQISTSSRAKCRRTGTTSAALT